MLPQCPPRGRECRESQLAAAARLASLLWFTAPQHLGAGCVWAGACRACATEAALGSPAAAPAGVQQRGPADARGSASSAHTSCWIGCSARGGYTSCLGRGGGGGGAARVPDRRLPTA